MCVCMILCCDLNARASEAMRASIGIAMQRAAADGNGPRERLVRFVCIEPAVTYIYHVHCVAIVFGACRRLALAGRPESVREITIHKEADAEK